MPSPLAHFGCATEPAHLPGVRGRPAKGRQKLPAFRRFRGLLLTPGRLTIMPVEDYIRSLGRAAAGRDGASAKPLTVHTVTEHPAMLFVAMFASPRRMCGVTVSPAPAGAGLLDDGAVRFRDV